MTHQTDDASIARGDRPHRFSFSIARLISLTLSIGLTLILVIWPSLITGSDRLLTQAVMPVMLLGIAGGLAHGFDFAPRHGVAATMLGPWVAWPLMLSSLAFLFLQNDL